MVMDFKSTAGRILLVEKDTAVRDAMRRALSQAGLRVTVAGCPDAATRLLNGVDGFDMLVTHVRMRNGGDGVELAGDWRRRTQGRPVLYVSGSGDHRLAPDQLGPREATLPKPFARARLVSLVQQLLENVQPLRLPPSAVPHAGGTACRAGS